MNIIKYIYEIFIKSWNQNPCNIISIIVLGVLCILLKIYYPKFRGFMGEFWLRNELKKLPRDKYLILNNVMLKDNYGTHQIDHIVISIYGIFVIEMKNYYGFITGKEYSNKWCQHLGKNKYYFQNPIHQNYGHIKCLMEILKMEEKNFTSIICFSNQAKLKVNTKSIITHIDLIRKEILNSSKVIMDTSINTEKIFEVINKLNIQDINLRKLHIKNLKKRD